VKEHYRALLGLRFRRIAVYTGQLAEQKGLDTLLRAWKLLRKSHAEVHLLLLGQGGAFRNVEPDLRRLAAELELEDLVHFCGHVPNPMDYLLASDCFVLPTRAEGMSNSLVEAMAAGGAIVTTNIPANLEIAEHGVNALLVAPNDPQGLAGCVARILDDPGLARRLGRAAREKAERDLSVDTEVSSYLSLYSKMVTS
jgi:glycosyltransferase involved in cell wall biosynthesis